MINLYNHGGSGNHGCEAIVRSTISLLNKNVNLLSTEPNQDKYYKLDQICNVIHDDTANIRKWSVQWFLASLQIKLSGKIDLLLKYQKRHVYKNISKGDILFSIGGDNYCYKGTEKLVAINNNLRKMKVKTVLWGCSVEPELIHDENIAKDLSNYDLIFARESISYNALRSINPNTYLVPDPAFALERHDVLLPEGWIEGYMIGINASPLILENAKDGEVVLNAYRKLIRYIISETPYHVALIPHVVWEYNDDRKPLEVLYNEFKSSGRIVLIDDYNCMELKGFIGRCKMFIGARTHSTIAAYSSCVPTVVLGYSVKARGIAKDLFGTDENYVLPVQGLKSEYDLVNGFKWLCQNENSIRQKLNSIIPDYRNKLNQIHDIFDKELW